MLLARLFLKLKRALEKREDGEEQGGNGGADAGIDPGKRRRKCEVENGEDAKLGG